MDEDLKQFLTGMETRLESRFRNDIGSLETHFRDGIEACEARLREHTETWKPGFLANSGHGRERPTPVTVKVPAR